MDYSEIVSILSTSGRVERLELDDTLRQHLLDRGTYSKHLVRLAEIVQVYENSPQYFPNTSATGRAPLIMVGQTGEERMLCIPIEPTGRWGVWRAVTAFEANTHHRQRYWEASDEHKLR